MRDSREGHLAIHVIRSLDDLGKQVRRELDSSVEIWDVDTFPSLDDIYSAKRVWLRIDEVVAVFADLKRSTRLGLGRHADTTARIYEAATGGMVRVVEQFHPAFTDIQGDGLFALFHGARRHERAMCAAITLKSFGQQELEPTLASRVPGLPETGLKVGVASGRLLVKRIGVRGTNEPVWAGRAVNFAAKCAQTADKGEVIVTPQVWQRFRDNEFVARECPCTHWLFRRSQRWDRLRVDKLPDSADDCRRLPARDRGWCAPHGDAFCQAILDGKTKVDDLGVAA